MILKYLILGLLLYLHSQIKQGNSESVAFISTEHPVVSWFDRKYIKNATLHSNRLNRQDPRYYVQMYVHTLITFDNSILINFYFYQFLTNRYQPSFVEMHLNLCDMLKFDPIFGATVRRALGNRSCPYLPGEYNMQNLSIPFVPKGFPFIKGRIYCNISQVHGGVVTPLGRGYIDMEIKMAKINNKTNK